MKPNMSLSCLALAALGLVASSAALAGENEGKKEIPVVEAADADAADAKIAVRDAVTGNLRAPTAEEHKALMDQKKKSKSLANSGDADMKPSHHRKNKRGIGSVRVPANLVDSVVITRNADGTLSQTCVQGEGTADAATHAGHSHTSTLATE